MKLQIREKNAAIEAASAEAGQMDNSATPKGRSTLDSFPKTNLAPLKAGKQQYVNSRQKHTSNPGQPSKRSNGNEAIKPYKQT